MIASRIVVMYGVIGEARHRETAEMKWLIAYIEENGEAETAAGAEARPIPSFPESTARGALLADTSLSRVTAAQCLAARVVTGAAEAAGEPDEAADLASRGIQESRRQILDDDRRVARVERPKERLHRHPLTQPFVCIVGRALERMISVRQNDQLDIAIARRPQGPSRLEGVFDRHIEVVGSV